MSTRKYVQHTIRTVRIVCCTYFHCVDIDSNERKRKSKPPPSWICWGSHGTTHEGTLVVRTPCKNFVIIGSVVFKLYGFEIFVVQAWKSYSRPQHLSLWGALSPKFRGTLFIHPKRHIFAWFHVFWAIACKNPSTGLTCARAWGKKV